MKNIWSLFKIKRDENGKPTKFSYIIILGLIGLLLVLLSSMFQEEDSANPYLNEGNNSMEQKQNEPLLTEDDKTAIISEMESKFERELKAILESLDGVSNVDIMINLDATNLKIYATNTVESQQTTQETDTNGGERTIEELTKDEQSVIIRRNNEESPLLIQVKKPDVRGVMVVASGLQNIEVKKMVVEAVSTVLDVPTHRVTANPKS
ncbi:stage III sporulation protein AG [Salirhabdus euzebyi]|uniref:Stage III sporulation protein AG n=1 Tax=Salirhabdus euzebyi TaxID=394506 RepID=A0A841Q7C9_9BACI|nr:stage III sporulation protein AG [Salirhabdus euzebyi]MBB6454227.1 stage III sporulation protein AG [Salirhabdus euzebyi]